MTSSPARSVRLPLLLLRTRCSAKRDAQTHGTAGRSFLPLPWIPSTAVTAPQALLYHGTPALVPSLPSANGQKIRGRVTPLGADTATRQLLAAAIQSHTESVVSMSVCSDVCAL